MVITIVLRKIVPQQFSQKVARYNLQYFHNKICAYIVLRKIEHKLEGILLIT